MMATPPRHMPLRIREIKIWRLIWRKSLVQSAEGFFFQIGYHLDSVCYTDEWHVSGGRGGLTCLKNGGWEENEGGGVGGGCRERMLIGSKRTLLLLKKASYIWH